MVAIPLPPLRAVVVLKSLLKRLSDRLIAFSRGCGIPCECARYRAELLKRQKENAPYRELQMLIRDLAACLKAHETAARIAAGGPLVPPKAAKRRQLWN